MIIPGFGPGAGQFLSGGEGWEITSQTTSTSTNPFYISPAAKPGDFAIFMDAAITPPDEIQVPFGWETIVVDKPFNATIVVASKILEAADFSVDLSAYPTSSLRSLTTLTLPAGMVPAPASKVATSRVTNDVASVSVGGESSPGFKFYVGFTNGWLGVTFAASNPVGWYLNMPSFFPTAIKYYKDQIQSETIGTSGTTPANQIGAFAGFNIKLTES